MTDTPFDAPVVVTGAGGYIGRHVVTALADRGVPVIAVVRPGSGAALDPRARRVEFDILAEDTLPDGLAEARALVHLAWRDGFVHNSPAHMLELSAHYAFLRRAAAAGVDAVVALGTMHEVGYWEGAIDAGTPTNPRSLYGVAKDALRRSLELGLPEDVRLVWARCYYIFGDDRHSNSIFARLLEAVAAGKSTFPFTTGRNKYDFIAVEELGRQLAAVALDDDARGVINCSSGEPVSLADQVEWFIRSRGLPITLEYGAFPDRPYDSPAVWGDATRIHEIMAALPD
ncbi:MULTISPECIES: NAD-dependent epimerase/dehydratase family protein [Microbacterium]|uniref:NAD(P)-dependent oxidoreductase n=1 Tax=Microbacterium schleiferi TaxID=69362 RepID=A0ABU7V2T7_9MICO|nr:NAD(P)-dependent oxidoreductase [Microbacterium sp. 67-17]OJV95491.1 MAG: epimerase [Microbacterium sp. 67-17]